MKRTTCPTCRQMIQHINAIIFHRNAERVLWAALDEAADPNRHEAPVLPDKDLYTFHEGDEAPVLPDKDMDGSTFHEMPDDEDDVPRCSSCGLDKEHCACESIDDYTRVAQAIEAGIRQYIASTSK
jgi:hypothetical protein